MEDGMYGVQYHHRHHHHQYHHHNSPSSSSSMHHHLHHHDDDLHSLIARIHPPTTTYAYASTSAGENNGIKAKIAAHPRYPSLLDAYIDCQKVGAPPEIINLLEKIRKEHGTGSSSSSSNRFDATSSDPELDLFMETYCDVLMKYKADLSRPFDEATSFLTSMELQLTDLCKTGVSFAGDEAEGPMDEEASGDEMEVQQSHVKDEERDIKKKLLLKYSGYLSSLKQEFSKKKKKGKLPKEARRMLLDWWNIHYKWPYPTEADKIALAELTGLDQKQINNWFINQRKRHWKASESMQYAVMNSLSAPYYG